MAQPGMSEPLPKNEAFQDLVAVDVAWCGVDRDKCNPEFEPEAAAVEAHVHHNNDEALHLPRQMKHWQRNSFATQHWHTCACAPVD